MTYKYNRNVFFGLSEAVEVGGAAPGARETTEGRPDMKIMPEDVARTLLRCVE